MELVMQNFSVASFDYINKISTSTSVELQSEIKTSTRINSDKKSLDANIVLSIHGIDLGDNESFSIKLTAVSNFTSNDPIDDTDSVNKKVSAQAFLYIRSLITSLTGALGTQPLHLPPIDMRD